MKSTYLSPSAANLPPKKPNTRLTEANLAHLPQSLALPLFKALTTSRGSGTDQEAEFAAWLTQYHPTKIDEAGNLHFDRRQLNTKSLFVAHIDTVARTTNDPEPLFSYPTIYANKDVLGADDGAGVAILAHMMDNNIPGYYIFTRGEEVGCVGSSWLADNMPDLLMQFDRAVAFDRAGTTEVITHQGERTASDEFANALSDQLNQTLLYMPSDRGVYTDTKEFDSLIPECTNLGVGYYKQHSTEETLDIEHLQALADAVIHIDWESLPTKRSVEQEPYTKHYSLYHAVNDFYNNDYKPLQKLLDFYIFIDVRTIPYELLNELDFSLSDEENLENLADALTAAYH